MIQFPHLRSEHCSPEHHGADEKSENYSSEVLRCHITQILEYLGLWILLILLLLTVFNLSRLI